MSNQYSFSLDTEEVFQTALKWDSTCHNRY